MWSDADLRSLCQGLWKTAAHEVGSATEEKDTK